ncbi:MAG: glutamate racemase [Leptospiraceae bacterium]|nr:glutamate racemase [Leptospiraceae bacterium]
MSEYLKIGVMDSGFGGLSVLEDLSSYFPYSDILYYGDLLNSPYGTKSKRKVLEFVIEIVNFFLSHNVNAVLLACNTATSAAVEYLREKHEIPIFGMEPAIKPALIENPNEQIAVLATSLTLREEKFENLGKKLNALHRIVPYNCDGLASLIDKEDLESARKFIQPILEDALSRGIRAVVLGCTHYVLMKDIFRELAPQMKFYDGNRGTVRHIYNTLKPENTERDADLDIYLNGGTEKDFEIAFRYLKQSKKETSHYVK